MANNRTKVESNAINVICVIVDKSASIDPDISKRLKSSVELARNAGVAEDEVLDSVEKIDEFFMR